MKKTEVITLPNLITMARILVIPPIWWLAFQGQSTLVAIFVLFELATDILDGALARRLNLESEFGSRLDTYADVMLTVSSLSWLYLLNPIVFINHGQIIFLTLAIHILYLFIRLVKFQRFGDMHTTVAKISGLSLGFLLAHTFITNNYSQTLFFITIGLGVLAPIEKILIIVVSEKLDGGEKSLMHVLKRRSEA